jgi:pyridoxamine 5'-phosphate oxidase
VTDRSAAPDVGFEDLDPDPLRQFQLWFEEARASDRILEPAAMSVASIGPDGPSSRIVLLRRVDERGFCFFTNYESQKGRELTDDPRVAAVFYWDPLRRQVRLTGRVGRTSEAESDEYHVTRAPGSQLAAWASDQSRPVADRATLERRYAEVVERFGGSAAAGEAALVPRPPWWGGFRIVPQRIEFWEARLNRLHDRIAYDRKPDGGWQRRRLMP